MGPGGKRRFGPDALPDMSGWTKRERVAYLARQGADAKVIAAILGMTPKMVRVVRAQLRAEGHAIPTIEEVAGYPVGFMLPRALGARAEAEAARHGLTVPDLMTAICTAVLAGDLVSAVLDDGVE